MNLKGKKINFLGDSITEGHGTTCEDARFDKIIEKMTGAVCRNYGIGGTRIAAQTGTAEEIEKDSCFCNRAKGMADDADIIVVFGGTNDFGHGNAPIGSMTDRRKDTFYGGMHILCRTLIEKYPESVIVFITPLHRCNEENPRGDGNKACDTGTLRDYVQIIRQVTEYYSLPTLDLFAESGMQPLVPIIKEKYIPDGLHPNDAGHRILALKIAHYLENM